MSTFENLSSLLQCIICYGQLENAHLCFKCSKAYCFDCITRHLNYGSSPCANCRHLLSWNSLVKCGWLEEVSAEVSRLKQMHSKADLDMCATHEEMMSIYCVDCRRSICPQCALWEGDHSSHETKALSKLYRDHEGRMDEKVKKAMQRKLELTGMIERIEKHRGNLSAEKDKKKQVNQAALEEMSRRLDSLEDVLRVAAMERTTSMNNEVESIDAKLSDMRHVCDSSSKSDIVNSSESIMQSVEECLSPPLIALQLDELISEIVPEFEKSTFVIDNFSQLQTRGDPIFSPSMTIHGLKWKLKVYPAGISSERGNYLSVFVELEGEPSQTEYECQIEMLFEGEADSERNFSQKFVFDLNGEGFSVNAQYYPLNSLSSYGFLGAETDTLTLRFGVRLPTFYLESKAQANYICHLSASNDALKQENDALKQENVNLKEEIATLRDGNT